MRALIALLQAAGALCGREIAEQHDDKLGALTWALHGFLADCALFEFDDQSGCSIVLVEHLDVPFVAIADYSTAAAWTGGGWTWYAVLDHACRVALQRLVSRACRCAFGGAAHGKEERWLLPNTIG